ncbi:MAG: phosphoadenosine phosphosulfate reductase family protein [Chlamydiia bacterium]|nr:phosphoadenosine phosphosulfate reductase family protein [Chlamydiia bacterium]
MSKVKHVLGISGGKDSAALAIYLKDKYPNLDVEYYTCDTGKELDETYQLIDNLEVYLGKKITQLMAAQDSPEAPFDHFLSVYGGYLPSAMSRWCTKKLKLEPFEQYIAGDQPIVSYVGIRGDEDREGYISKKPNIQSIFPFRKNIWSEDVIRKVLANSQIPFIKALYEEYASSSDKVKRILEVVEEPVSMRFPQEQKLEMLLDLGVKDFNLIVFAFLKTTDYPLAQADAFPLIDNEDVLVREDIFQILRDSGVGVPAYYERREYQVEIDGELKTGHYSRSRSGCFFCFFQQKIEWVWLYENHQELFLKATEYEKDGYTWQQGETLEELSEPGRREAIKREHFLRMERQRANAGSDNLIDILGLDEAEGVGCAACFI